MIMENRSKRLSEPLRWGKREKTIVGALLVCVLAAAIALGVFALTSGSREPADCVNVTFASTLGAAREHACGAQAREVCASPEAFKHSAQALRESCRRAGYPFE
jgi:hypothetical protein